MHFVGKGRHKLILLSASVLISNVLSAFYVFPNDDKITKVKCFNWNILSPHPAVLGALRQWKGLLYLLLYYTQTLSPYFCVPNCANPVTFTLRETFGLPLKNIGGLYGRIWKQDRIELSQDNTIIWGKSLHAFVPLVSLIPQLPGAKVLGLQTKPPLTLVQQYFDGWIRKTSWGWAVPSWGKAWLVCKLGTLEKLHPVGLFPLCSTLKFGRYWIGWIKCVHWKSPSCRCYIPLMLSFSLGSSGLDVQILRSNISWFPTISLLVWKGTGGNKIGPSGVRALHLAAGRNVGGHYFWYINLGMSGGRALPLAAGINEGGHYFRYFSFFFFYSSRHRYSKPQKGLPYGFKFKFN